MKTPYFRTLLAILRKDLRAELRSREIINAMALFALLSVLVFSFALELNRETRVEVIGGILWVTLVFASILGLNRSLAGELDQGGLDAMLMAPVDRSTIFVGKLIGNFLFVLVIGLILLPLMSVLYNVSLVKPDMLAVVILGTLGFAAIGTLLATMTVQTRSRETMLPLVMMPTALPILLLAVRASREIVVDGMTPAAILTLLFIDIMYLLLCTFLYDYVIED
jgi:heme exporter protein B